MIEYILTDIDELVERKVITTERAKQMISDAGIVFCGDNVPHESHDDDEGICPGVTNAEREVDNDCIE